MIPTYLEVRREAWGLGGDSKKEGGRSPRGDRTRQQGTCSQTGQPQGPEPERWREMERHHGEGAGSGHTDHAPAAAAAPAPRAHAGAVAQCVKAQDSADAVSNQHHLGERRRHQEGLRRRQAGGRPPRRGLPGDSPRA